MMYANLYQPNKYRNKLQYQQKALKVKNYEDIIVDSLHIKENTIR